MSEALNTQNNVLAKITKEKKKQNERKRVKNQFPKAHVFVNRKQGEHAHLTSNGWRSDNNEENTA